MPCRGAGGGARLSDMLRGLRPAAEQLDTAASLKWQCAAADVAAAEAVAAEATAAARQDVASSDARSGGR